MAEDSFAAGLVGITLEGRYRLDAVLGEGGMGAVFRAQHLQMDRKVAVKLLKPHLVNDEAATQRFLREARSTLKVDSPHAVKVLDFGITPQRDYYIVLEYLDGRTVQRELDVDGPFAPLRVLHIAQHALEGLAVAHERGLIHRDIKPDNILLMRVGDDHDFTKVLDFGVAKLMEGGARTDRSALALTAAGTVFGTPEFMSPEQACGHALDARSDLYSLAATIFAMLTGCGMFTASSPIEWLTHHARTPPPHLADALPALEPYREVDAVLQRCLAKQRDQRPTTAREMARLLADLECHLRGEPARPASIEPRRDPGGGARSPHEQPMLQVATPRFSPSSFIAALPVETLPASPTTGSLAPRSRRGLWLALGALAVLGVVATAIAIVATHDPDGPRPAPEVVATTRGVPSDARVLAAGDTARPVDAAVAVVAADAAAARPAAPPHHPGGGEVARLLADAEHAARTGNRLHQITQADAALRLDPHSVRAKLLLADGEIAYGDLDLGCKYLRELKHSAEAAARAKSAGCPTD